ncbi:DUF2583 family protein [Rosenbergiella australiborealis]|uniref:Stress-induced protein YchH n=1 Tax=Rosenbergiella australiborealis TaxID=1544696 RepID=A0ABS5T2H0_9GAMM|nr:DUF2583 family protein [Rosenbergiella australiborealis]MBT0726547.1 stress-induced protein YchH [Rosenbergiella australiborealis]
MKRQHALCSGNALMAIGLVMSLFSLLIALLSHAGTIPFTTNWATVAVLGIFCGAFIWLLGAQISGRETVYEKYYLLRFYQRFPRRRRH